MFISSLISGMEPVRAAARDAVETLRHAPVMAEDFGAQPKSPQVACLSELRQSDLVILILGEHYGSEQASGLSATHEEYREAQGRKDVIAFVQDGATPDPKQVAFIREVQEWAGGLFRGGFKGPTDLHSAIIRALYDHALANAVGPLDEAGLIKRSLSLLPAVDRNSFTGSSALSLAIAGGPTQQILRPAEIEDAALSDALHQAAMFGATRVLDQSKGVEKGILGAALIIRQEHNGPLVQLDEQGGLLLRAALGRTSADRRGNQGGLPILLEEDVHQQLTSTLALAAWTLDRIDPTQRLTHVAVSARIDAGDYLAWRTQPEHDRSPNSVSMGMGGSERAPIHLIKPRAALRSDIVRLVEDLLVPLRRQWKH